MNPIRILIADDHQVLRAGLKLLIHSQPDMVVVGEADNGHEAWLLAQECLPDVILLDLTMSHLNGLETLPLLRKTVPQCRVLVLTMHDDESYLRETLHNGAVGYVVKKAADNELLSAIRAVMRGEIYVHPSMTKALLEDIMPHADSTNPWDILSEREQEVLLLVARGLTSAKIAEDLNLSPKTVETYRARGMEKLALRSRAALVQFAINHHLLG